MEIYYCEVWTCLHCIVAHHEPLQREEVQVGVEGSAAGHQHLLRGGGVEGQEEVPDPLSIQTTECQDTSRAQNPLQQGKDEMTSLGNSSRDPISCPRSSIVDVVV